MKYNEYLKSKTKRIQESGIKELDQFTFNSNLFDYQEFITNIALEHARYAIFADCGLGKTIMQLEWSRIVSEYTNKKVLIIAPLAVSRQTIEEGNKFGIKICSFFNQDESNTHIINYENIDHINVDDYAGVVLDESSIIKNHTGKYKTALIDMFKDYRFKLCCTATPSPNDVMELGNHAEFLNVMSYTEMLAMYFIHDGGETQKWRLKKHSKNDFWGFVSSWSCMFNKPSDLGFEDTNYCLPKLNLHQIKINTPNKDNGLLLNEASINSTEFSRELRLTKESRLNKAIEIATQTDETVIIWVKLNEEADYIKKHLPEAVEVRGDEKPEIKQDKLLGFAQGKFKILLTKSKIAQFGLNFQSCHKQIFASLDFSFESTYQSMRRSWRFGQKHDVDVYLITTDTMSNVKQTFDKKKKQFEEMQKAMINNFTGAIMQENKEQETKHIKENNFELYMGDCVQEIKKVKDESVGFSIFSPPFADLYTYSDSVQDMGNSISYKDFKDHFEYLLKDLNRVMQKGRNVVVHCADLPIQKGKHGFIGLRDFSGLIHDSFINNDFIYHSRITIWKDPVVEMQRTKALGLLHKQVKKDSTMSRVGLPDYLMVFRKRGENESPIKNDHINVDEWQKIASPVWHDIRYTKTLQYRNAKGENDEKHICPLQLDTIERAIKLWSNKDDVVFTPFMGIGSECYQALKMNRKTIGIELKKSYFDVALKNCYEANNQKGFIDIFNQ